ncbi:hypothetical protein [Humibacter ginsenosidimutans]|uniref:Phage tail protein n=1 Tax=Humibacter ginsenosidimutans TaxID=2599293 RepID=A0A5B8M385_9MICO|nr:hypothetical protein [Humibacter ginsenosidimutans]QDZ14245.1 hypothetical protein FPZ11_05220 [Humibacter ginsenosidimutans]
MSAVEVEPLFMSNCTFSVASDSYEAALSGVTITPTTPITTWTGLAPGSVFTKAGKATWVCALDAVQDWSTATSLSNYLHAHEGDTIAVTFVPDADDDESPTISVNLIVVPGTIGGKVNAFAESSVSMPCQGKPTVTPVSGS